MATKLSNHSVSAYWTQEIKTLNNPVPSSTNGTNKKVWINSRSGDSVPNWKRTIAMGGNASSSYSCVFEEHFPPEFSAGATITRPSNGRMAYTKITGSPQFLWPTLADPATLNATLADKLAREQFIAKYRQRRTQFQSGVFLGELMRTVQMIRQPALALRQSLVHYHQVVKYRLNRFPRHQDRVVKATWLEYQMGVRPLIKDIESIARLACADPFVVMQVLTGKGKDVQTDVRDTGSYGASILSLWWHTSTKAEVDIKYKGAVGFRNEPPGFPEQLGLSWSNFLPTVWELIPYSFLVDYFTNVGKVIDGISTGTVSLAWGCKNQWRRNTAEIGGLAVSQTFLMQQTLPGDKVSSYASGNGKLSSRSQYHRSPISGVSVGFGDLRFKLPGSGTRWLNIAALAKLRR